MNNENIYTLDDRGIIYICGDDTSDFLQNIITNDIYKVTDNKSCFASLLTPQGKYLFDFIIIKHKKGYFLDCEKLQIDDLFKQLSLYKLRSNIKILNLSNEFIVAALSLEKFISMDGSKDELYSNAVDIIKSEGKASTSYLQRKLQIGYNRAARIIDMMEEEGIVSKANHVGKREVLKK